MLTTGVTASAAMLSLMVNGLPLQATYLQTDRDGCEAARQTALQWQLQPGVQPVQAKINGWCSVGAVIAGRWVSEQWRTLPVSGKTSGWRVVMPLPKDAGQQLSSSGQKPWNTGAWQLDVMDPQIGARIRYRQSLHSLDLHHQEGYQTVGRPLTSSQAGAASANPIKLSRHRQGEVLLSGRHPDGGSYSVLIERGLEK